MEQMGSPGRYINLAEVALSSQVLGRVVVSFVTAEFRSMIETTSCSRSPVSRDLLDHAELAALGRFN